MIAWRLAGKRSTASWLSIARVCWTADLGLQCFIGAGLQFEMAPIISLFTHWAASLIQKLYMSPGMIVCRLGKTIVWQRGAAEARGGNEISIV